MSHINDPIYPHGRHSSKKPLRRPCPRELRSFFSCMAWRAIPSPLSKLILLASILTSIRVSSNESALRIRWAGYRTCSFSITPCNEACCQDGIWKFRPLGVSSAPRKPRAGAHACSVASSSGTHASPGGWTPPGSSGRGGGSRRAYWGLGPFLPPGELDSTKRN